MRGDMSRTDLLLLLSIAFVYALGWADTDKASFALLWVTTCKVCAAANKYLEQK